MNLRKVTASAMILCLILSVMIFIEKPVERVKNDRLAFSVGFEGYWNPLNLTSRAIIYNYINNNPGAHFRQICNELSISIGSAQYHLDRLVDGELLESKKESKYRRYFVSRRFSEFEKTLISWLNRTTTKRVIELVNENGGKTHQELAVELGITSQAITWQVQRLIEKEILTSVNIDNVTRYHISEKTLQCLPRLG